jgi:hypothetical protein
MLLLQSIVDALHAAGHRVDTVTVGGTGAAEIDGHWAC